MGKAFNKAKEILQESLPSCQSRNAWEERFKNQFMKCTEEISGTNGKIFEALTTIEKFASNNLKPIISVDSQAGFSSNLIFLFTF